MTSSDLQMPVNGRRMSDAPFLSSPSSLTTSSFYLKANGHD
ncbi:MULTISPECIES: hypothetical protein [Shinella]|nr:MULTISPECIES: hypothetical protein [Shinella]